MSEESSKTPDDGEEATAPAEAEPAAPVARDEPIEAEFEPADSLSLWRRLAERQVTMPIALGLAAGAVVLGGFLGVALDGGRGVSPAQIEAAVDRRLAPFEELRTEVRQAIAEGSGDGIAAAALNDLQAEIASLRSDLTTAQNRLRAVESAGGSGEAGAALADELETLRADVAEAHRMAEEALGAPSAQSAEIDALDTRLTALAETARAQGRAIEQLSQASSVLAGRVTGVPAPAGLATAGAAAALAFASLQEAALSGQPFTPEAADAAVYFGENEHMETLLRHADTGAPTPAQLAVRFREVARDAREADRPTGGGVVERLGRGVAGLVTVRRLDAPETDAVGDVVVRAQRRLMRDDLVGAAAELDRLEGPAGEAVASWVEQARARAEIDASLDGLRSSFTEG
jgi:hypothetical protein